MKLSKKDYQTFAVTFFMFVVFVEWVINIPFIVRFFCLLIGLFNLLGWLMDKYFLKKYGTEVLPFAKDTYPTLFKDEKQIDNSPFGRHKRKIKEWWNKLMRKKHESQN